METKLVTHTRGCPAAWLPGHLTVKPELRAGVVSFSWPGLAVMGGSGYKLIVMSGDWTRPALHWAAAMNHILMLSV